LPLLGRPLCSPVRPPARSLACKRLPDSGWLAGWLAGCPTSGLAALSPSPSLTLGLRRPSGLAGGSGGGRFGSACAAAATATRNKHC